MPDNDGFYPDWMDDWDDPNHPLNPPMEGDKKMKETPAQARRRKKHENKNMDREGRIARRSAANFLRRGTKAMEDVTVERRQALSSLGKFLRRASN